MLFRDRENLRKATKKINKDEKSKKICVFLLMDWSLETCMNWKMQYEEIKIPLFCVFVQFIMEVCLISEGVVISSLPLISKFHGEFLIEAEPIEF